MTEILRHYLFYTFHSLTKYDYMAIGWAVFLAFLLMFLGAFIRRRAFSYFLLLLGILLLFAGPPAIKVVLDGMIRAASVSLAQTKVLRYSNALLIEGNITNRGKIDFSSCDLVITLYRPDKLLGPWSALLRPRQVEILPFEDTLPKSTAKPFRLLVDPLLIKSDFNTSVTARCYP